MTPSQSIEAHGWQIEQDGSGYYRAFMPGCTGGRWQSEWLPTLEEVEKWLDKQETETRTI